MTEYTPAQLEAWAGSGPWEWCENWLYVANYNEHPGPVLWYTANDDGVHAKPDDAALIAAAPDLARLVLEKDKEIARLKAKLTQTPTAEWFYDPDCMESCHFTVHEVIDSMELPEGKHVVEVSTAAPLPSIWCAVTVDYKGGGDEPLKIDEFETEEAARQAMKETSDD